MTGKTSQLADFIFTRVLPRQMPAGLICGTSHGIEPWGRFEPFWGKNRGEVVLRILERAVVGKCEKYGVCRVEMTRPAEGPRRADFDYRLVHIRCVPRTLSYEDRLIRGVAKQRH